MGQGNSKQLFIQILKTMLRAHGVKTGSKLEKFLSFIEEICAWFPEEGTISLETWEKVGTKIKDFYSAHGPEKVPVEAFSLWSLIRDCLDPQHSPLPPGTVGIILGRSSTTESGKSTN